MSLYKAKGVLADIHDCIHYRYRDSSYRCFDVVSIQEELYPALQEVKSVISIGSYSMFSQLINQCAGNLDVLVIGKLFPLATLGEYSLAKELAFMPLRVIGPLLQQVFTPYLALISSNQQKLKDYFPRLINVNSLFHLLFVLLFLLAGKWMVYLLYGKA